MHNVLHVCVRVGAFMQCSRVFDMPLHCAVPVVAVPVGLRKCLQAHGVAIAS